MKSTKYLGLLLFLFLAINCKKNDDDGTISPVVLSDEKKITSFLFDASSNSVLSDDIIATINESSKTISATVPNNTDVTLLQPTIQISNKAVVDSSGAKDFSNAVVYTVTAEDKSIVEYTVTIVVETNDEKAITLFQFSADDNGLAEDVASIIDEEAKTISVYVPNTADMTNLSPTIETSAEATYAPTGFQNFTDSATYTVTAEDGSMATYKVIVIPVKISSFSFVRYIELLDKEVLIGEGTIDEGSGQIEVLVPGNTDVTDLPVPRIDTSDEVTVAPLNQKDFTNTVSYTLTAPNGLSVTYEVVVRKAEVIKEISRFRFMMGQNPGLVFDAEGEINQTEATIHATITLTKFGSAEVLKSLLPTVSVVQGSGAIVSPTGRQDFSKPEPVPYTVTGLDGTTKTYMVSITMKRGN